ncbi:MAG: hypothetical protein ACPHID_07695 [Thermoplasmatota archaeon]
MSAVAGFFKGLGAVGLILGPIALIAGLIVGLGGLNDVQGCGDRENSFNPCTDMEGEVIQGKLIGGGIAAASGVVLVLLGSLFFFTARGAERRAELRAQETGMPAVPRADDEIA